MKYGLDEINLNLISIGMKFLFIKKKKKDFGIRHTYLGIITQQQINSAHRKSFKIKDENRQKV